MICAFYLYCFYTTDIKNKASNDCQSSSNSKVQDAPAYCYCYISVSWFFTLLSVTNWTKWTHIKHTASRIIGLSTLNLPEVHHKLCYIDRDHHTPSWGFGLTEWVPMSKFMQSSELKRGIYQENSFVLFFLFFYKIDKIKIDRFPRTV